MATMVSSRKQPVNKGPIIVFKVDGMHCTACSKSAERELRLLKGVHNVEANLKESVIGISFDEEVISKARVIRAINDLGFRVKYTVR